MALVRHTILNMVYEPILQSILTFCLICVFGNMRNQDKALLEKIVKQGSRIIGHQQDSLDSLFKLNLCNKIKLILSDGSHPLHGKFLQNSRSNRLLQRRIRTGRYGSSFVPAAIRWYNEQLERWAVVLPGLILRCWVISRIIVFIVFSKCCIVCEMLC